MVQQRTALVTGASSGFGLLISVELAQAGYQVAATMRNPERAERLWAAAREAGVEARIDVWALDVTDEAQAQAVAAEVIERYGRLDVLVNNAGYAVGGFVEDVSMEEWRAQMETNFFGVLHVTKAFLPYLRQQRSGRILNISSVSGLFGFPVLSPYVASKFALEGLSESMRYELHPFGIDVVLVEPASYKTDIWGKTFDDFAINPDSPYAEHLRKFESITRDTAANAGNASEVATLVVRLANAKRTKLRYAIGPGAKLMVTLKRLLPGSWIEAAVKRQTK